MGPTSSALKFAGSFSFIALCLWAAPVCAQSAGGTGGTPSNGGSSGSSGAVSQGGAGNGGGGAPSSGGGEQSGATATAGASSAGAPGGAGAPALNVNLVTNGTFDTDTSPWWGSANNTDAYPADNVLAVTNGQLCATMTIGGGQNVWDDLIGLSDVPLVKNQYYHIKFSVMADAARTIKFKTGLGVAPYTDYFVEPVPITSTLQTVEYTYLNLRDDATAQFQLQIGSKAGTVCIDDVVIEPVATPAMPSYTTAAPSGHPFKDYKAIVKMGTAVDTPIFLSNPLHNAIVAGEFSMITPANSMKMNLIQPAQGTFDFTDTDALVAWAQTNGLEFRGHPLVWHTQTPDWLNNGTFDRDQMIDVMYKHIDALMGRYAGKFPYWDVVNEAVDQVNGAWTYRSTIWHDRIGDDFMDLAFTHARAADPKALLFYNDYNIEQMGNAKADEVFTLVQSMKSRGIPIDGVGFQGHYYIEPDGTTTGGVPDMQAIRNNMARYNDIGVEVQITECDFRIGKPLDDNKTQVQNKFYADLLQVCIDAPNCSHFTVWGLSDLDSWVPSTFPDYDYAHLFDTKLMPKPDYFAMSAVFAQASAGAGGAGAGGAGGSSAGAPVGIIDDGAATKGSSGGCSLDPRNTGAAPWLLMAFAMSGVSLYRRRSKAQRS